MNVRTAANAFVPTAVPSKYIPSTPLQAINRFKRKHGGLWVGGTVSVSESGVAFTPNRLNRTVHEQLQPIDVRARDIRAVRYEFGWLTGVVVVEHEHGEFRFRCHGAKRLAARMFALFNGRTNA